MQVGDPVLHIDLTKWADILVIVPLTPHCMAQLAYGLCNDLLTSVARAWPPAKPLLMVPVMHRLQWQHPVTHEHLDRLAVHGNYCMVVGEQVLLGGSISRSQAPATTLPDAAEMALHVQQCLASQLAPA